MWWWWRRPGYYVGPFGCLFGMLMPIFIIGIVISVVLSIVSVVFSIVGSIVSAIAYFLQTYFIHLFFGILIIFIGTKICKTLYAKKNCYTPDIACTVIISILLLLAIISFAMDFKIKI